MSYCALEGRNASSAARETLRVLERRLGCMTLQKAGNPPAFPLHSAGWLLFLTRLPFRGERNALQSRNRSVAWRGACEVACCCGHVRDMLSEREKAGREKAVERRNTSRLARNASSLTSLAGMQTLTFLCETGHRGAGKGSHAGAKTQQPRRNGTRRYTAILVALE